MKELKEYEIETEKKILNRTSRRLGMKMPKGRRAFAVGRKDSGLLSRLGQSGDGGTCPANPETE